MVFVVVAISRQAERFFPATFDGGGRYCRTVLLEQAARFVSDEAAHALVEELLADPLWTGCRFEVCQEQAVPSATVPTRSRAVAVALGDQLLRLDAGACARDGGARRDGLRVVALEQSAELALTVQLGERCVAFTPAQAEELLRRWACLPAEVPRPYVWQVAFDLHSVAGRSRR